MAALLPACSNSTGLNDPDTNPQLAAVVIEVSANYLRHIVRGERKGLNSLVLWSDYLRQSKNGLTPDQYSEQMRTLRAENQPAAEHPLLQLDVADVSVKGDDASVTFRKVNKPSADPIRVDLFWTGSGWMVVDDSIFEPAA